MSQKLLLISMLVLSQTTPLRTVLSAELFPYQDSQSTTEERVEDLLSRMSTAEKVAQLDMLSGRSLAGVSHLNVELATRLLGEDGLGSVHDFYPADAVLANELQAFIMDHNRWQIPALFIEECLHGYVQAGSTCFPVPMAMAASWDPEVVAEIGQAIASEARAHGTHVGLSPVLGIARDPRWGRVEETFGEDTQLASVMGCAMVRGMQGKDLCDTESIASVVKHFAMHSIPLSGSNSSPGYTGRREALQYFLPVFQTAICDAGARGVMTAYSEWNGVPCTGDSWLLTDLLRTTWGFQGFTLADMGAIRMLGTCHFTTASNRASLARALQAGVDMQFYDFPGADFRRMVLDLVDSGDVSHEVLDRAAGDVLRLKFELGLFEAPFTRVSPQELASLRGSNHELARRVAQESIILLKNDGVLPIAVTTRRIALLGPGLDSDYTGGYSPREAQAASLLEGLQEQLPDNVDLKTCTGVSFLDEGLPVPSRCLWTKEGSAGLSAAYYSNAELAGDPTLIRIDPQLEFSWDTHSPADGLPADSFSVCWEGVLIPNSDVEGWLGLGSDDGSRLWLDGSLVIDGWHAGASIRRTPVQLYARHEYPIRVEYRELQWGASVSLRWSQAAEDIEGAVDLARWADLAVVALGENGMLVGENRDRMALELSGNQSELLRRVSQIGTPIVLVLQSGRPIALDQEVMQSSAILASFFGGEASGHALADVLLGKVDATGRLPVTMPRHTGQIPCYYNRTPSKIMRYSDGEALPQFSFGHGLSYTRFSYENLHIEGLQTNADTLHFSLRVTNTGDRPGITIVQIYIRDLISSVTSPLLALKDFRRVELDATASATLHFALPLARLQLVNEEGRSLLEPGSFELMVGTSSADIRLRDTFEITD